MALALDTTTELIAYLAAGRRQNSQAGTPALRSQAQENLTVCIARH